MSNSNENQYYVYVYIDPRNLEEFYFGKGKGARKFSHLSDQADSDKVARIKEIAKEGHSPIIKTVACDLTEEEAFLIETTLIWKLGKNLTNIASGKYVSHFRPANTLHREIPGFDYKNDVYYINVGESEHRNWDDCKTHGFISAGQGENWRNQILRISEGDIIIAYLKGYGYVGVGKAKSKAIPYLEFRIDKKLLSSFDLKAPKMWENSDNPEMCEYIVGIQWLSAFDRENAKWKPNSGLFTSQLVTASLEKQPITISFIESEFNLNLKSLSDE